MDQKSLSLLDKIKLVTEKALEKKALHPILTKYQILEQDHIPFLIRMVENLERKDNEKKKQKQQQKKSNTFFNPFLPYDRDLFIDNIGDNHVAILNKFNVFDHHLLIVTREFESQESALNFDDFSALWTVLSNINGLGFYNSGKLSGASQPHKHLQLVPYPLAQEIETIPINNLVLSYKNTDEIVTLKELPFLHSIEFFENNEDKSCEELGQITVEKYERLLERLNIKIKDNKPSQNYNLLITKEWIMMIPRSQEKLNSISINSLGFAGGFLVKNEEQLNLIKNSNLLEILAQVAIKSN
ncbi:ATP adenylyltransferase family protein [Geminocystis sp. CENA526]|uniref:ATP adenylyltransferase family protein n=1 Tax=Geminocystis sp. CENA526 TaxID=1355871 RepID=UPI003D6FC358